MLYFGESEGFFLPAKSATQKGYLQSNRNSSRFFVPKQTFPSMGALNYLCQQVHQ
jgi:hypothetical protein